MKILMFLFLALLMALSFHLGGTWAVSEIRNDLNKSGFSIAQYGDTLKTKIIGTANDI